jgi:putative membrane protein
VTEIAAADRRLHPATLVGSTLKTIPQAVGGLAAYGAVVAEAGIGRVLLFAAAGALVAAGIAFLHWWRFRYGIGAAEIVIESGIFSRQRRVIPLHRVQDVAIEQGLLARLFGTAKVRIETGGSAADEGELDSISLADAEGMRDLIRGQAMAPEEVREEEPLLFAMNVRRVLTAGLFNFSLVFLAVIFGAFQYLEPWIGRFWDKPERWVGRAEQATGAFTVSAWAALGLLLLLAGLVSGVARTLARDYGFRLTRTPAGLRRRRGLFTLSEAVIPIRRVQLAAVESGFIERRFGWFRLQVQTLGAESKAGGRQTAAPFARMEEIAPIVEEVGLALPPGDAAFVRSPRRAIVRRAFVPVVLGCIAAAVGLAFEPRALIVAGLLFAVAAASGLAWRRHAYLLVGDTLYVRGGLATRRLWIVPVARAQTISVRRSALQRRLRLATVLVDTAGATVGAPRVLDIDLAEVDLLAARLLVLFNVARLRGGQERPAGTGAAPGESL